MKLLFDQNISFRIIELIKEHFPNAKHINQVGLKNKTDKQIWNFAKENNYAIVTFDSDFRDFNTLFGTPPKIIWIRIGNTTTEKVAEKITQKYDAIEDFINAPEYSEVGVLEIYSQ